MPQPPNPVDAGAAEVGDRRQLPTLPVPTRPAHPMTHPTRKMTALAIVPAVAQVTAQVTVLAAAVHPVLVRTNLVAGPKPKRSFELHHPTPNGALRIIEAIRRSQAAAAAAVIRRKRAVPARATRSVRAVASPLKGAVRRRQHPTRSLAEVALRTPTQRP